MTVKMLMDKRAYRNGVMCRSRKSTGDRMSVWKRGAGPYNMILPELCKGRECTGDPSAPGSAKWTGIQCRASLPLRSKLLRRVCGFGGFATRPPQKTDPLFGGEDVCGTGQTK